MVGFDDGGLSLGILHLLLRLLPFLGLVVHVHESANGAVLATAVLVVGRVEHPPEVLLGELRDGVLRLETVVLNHPLLELADNFGAVELLPPEHGTWSIVQTDVGEHLGEARVSLPVMVLEACFGMHHRLQRKLEQPMGAEPYWI